MKFSPIYINEEWVSPQRRMIMNAGSSFFHEEATPEGDVEMLQIFSRPNQADLVPLLQFSHKESLVDEEGWSLLLAPENEGAVLFVRQDAYVFEKNMLSLEAFQVPQKEGYITFTYVMDGKVEVNHQVVDKYEAFQLEEGDENHGEALSDTTLLVFLLAISPTMTYAGNVSGVKR